MKCKPEEDVSCPRYLNPLGSLLDQISFFMVYPWASLAASAISYYIESKQPCSWICRIIEKFILGPFFAFIFSVSFSSRLLYFLLVLSFVSSSSVNITYLHTYLSTYLPTYLLTYLSTYLPTYIPTYISIPLYTNEGIHYSILYLPI